jgi:hypothetical protein
MRYQHQIFAHRISGFCLGARILDAHPKRCNRFPVVIFLDVASLPWGDAAVYYWAQRVTTHVFYWCEGDLDDAALQGLFPQRKPSPLPGWEARSVSLFHCAAGGGTSGIWLLVAWYPPLRRAVEPLDHIPQP